MWPRSAIGPSPNAIPRSVSSCGGSSPPPAPSWPFWPLTTTTLLSPTRQGGTVELEADHRRHAVIEDVIRDLKYGVGLNHLPSGRFGANAAWMILNIIAHNLGRWTGRIGLGAEGPPMTTKTLRTRLLDLPGRLTTSGGKRTLHLPRAWPWKEQFNKLLDGLRTVALVT